jgi:hypothetical protein
VEALREQAAPAYAISMGYPDNMSKHVYLRGVHETSETEPHWIWMQAGGPHRGRVLLRQTRRALWVDTNVTLPTARPPWQPARRENSPARQHVVM